MGIEIGEILSCKIDTLEDFGVYLDYEGNKIFVKIVDVTWDDGPVNLKEYFKNTNIVDVKIIGTFKEKYFGAYYLGSIKEASLSGDPWLSYNYSVGGIYSGKVVSIAEYGYLIRIMTGAVGLIKSNKKIKLKLHQNISVKILDVNTQAKRLLLDLSPNI